MDGTKDEFRLMEKRVKNYGRKVLANQSSKSKRQKLKMNAGKAANETDFHWNEVVDVCNVRYSCLQVVACNETIVSQGDKNVDWSATNSNCKVYDLSSISPGLFLVSGALAIEQQIYWASKGVEEYSTVEHNNLNNLQSIYGNTETDEATSSKVTPAKDIPNVEDLWINSVDEDIPFETFAKLRWSCLGYHYDWTKRMYQKNLKSTFPPDLASLCTNLAHLVNLDLTVEAAIVNYYPTSANMGGHLDDAEHTMEKPIISISLGCSAIFLIGSTTREVKPTPILVRSGDAVIMSGTSRYCYHGVPLILNATFCPLEAELYPDVSNTNKLLQHAQEQESDSRTMNVVKYLQQARINMNVRQVRVNPFEESDEWVEKNGTGATAKPFSYA
eukprot:gene9731-11437_t